MEPEIIRMYSSSPPPLDSVADDDDDNDFGEFGGFSEVNNSGFAEFDAGNYPKSREDFIPSKHLRPINDYTENSVNNFASLTSIKASENVTEISCSKKGLSSVFDLNTNHETTQFNDAALNKGSSGEIDKHVNSETHLSSLDNVDLVSRIQDQIVNTCNGEKIHGLEGLTNGFTTVDSANPQGLQDMDCIEHLKGFKSVSSQSTDLSIDFSPPSPGDEFADFATFSGKEPADLGDTDPQAHNDLHKGQTSSINENTKLRFADASLSTPSALDDPDSEDMKELDDLVPVNPPLEPDPLAVGRFPSPLPMAPSPEINISNSMHSPDTKRTPGLTQNTNEDILDDVSLTHEKSLDAKQLTLDLNKESDCSNIGNIFHENPEFDSPFGDLDAATKESPPPLKDSSDSSETPFHAPLGLGMNELDDDFGDFKDMNNDSLSDELAVAMEKQSLADVAEHHSQHLLREETEHSDFGHFVSLENKEEWGTVQSSDDFAEFSSAGAIAQPPEWNAFEDDQGELSSWAAFEDQKTSSQAESDDWESFRTDVPSSTDIQVSNTQSDGLPAFHESKANIVCEDSNDFQHSLMGRLERAIQACFPLPSVANIEEIISPLDLLLCTEQQEESSKSKPSSSLHTEVLDIWIELQEIHDAYGLKYQWGGSHSNKKLLCCLGIDTRNILFTGNKKQPVIVPMYAAGLGMLEPTKEPLKPVSAAEKIASIGQSSHTPPDDISSSDPLQDSLPPVQFDWSSSGLTNPLDGVDPELYALTTSKVECSSASNKVTDAFAKLMSTAETTSTSASHHRKLCREENLSEEAAKVIASLPDLSFMHAKVLMFPVSLTPLSSSEDRVD